MRSFAAALLALALAAPALAAGPEPGDAAPPLEVKDWANGGPVTLAECEGEVAIVLFFQSNAPQMARYIQDWVTCVKAYGPKGARVIGITREAQETIAAFADEQKLNFPIAVDKNEGTWNAYAIGGLGYPFVYVIGVYGEVAYRGDGNRYESAIGPIEHALKDVRRINVKRADTSKAFDSIWKAIDKNEWPKAIHALDGLAKGKDEADKANAEAILKDLVAMADARLARVAELEKRKDYGPAEALLRSTERSFAGLPQAKAAKETRERWLKDKAIKSEIEAFRLVDQGRALEAAKKYKEADDAYRAALAHLGTRGAARASGLHADLVRRRLVPPS